MCKLLIVHINLANDKFRRGIIPEPDPITGEPLQPVGDLVGVYRNNHEFSDVERSLYEIISIPGINKTQMERNLPRVETKEINDGPDEFEYWLDGTVWRKLADKPMHEISIANLSQLQIDTLTSDITSDAEKIIVIQAMRNNLKENPLNQVAEGT